MATEFAVHLWGITIIPSLQLLTAPSWIAFTVHDNHHCMTIHQLTSHYYCVLLRFSVHIVNPLCTSHTWSFTKLFHILSRINLESAWCCYREYVNVLDDTRDATGTKPPVNYYEPSCSEIFTGWMNVNWLHMFTKHSFVAVRVGCWNDLCS